eukprot:3941460-Rhodomonas_salina.4
MAVPDIGQAATVMYAMSKRTSGRLYRTARTLPQYRTARSTIRYLSTAQHVAHAHRHTLP